MARKIANRKSQNALKRSLAVPVCSRTGETDLTHMITRTKRIGFFVLIATVLIACIGGDAFAQADKVRDRNLASNARAGEPVKSAGAGPTLGPIRYYGGPKSRCGVVRHKIRRATARLDLPAKPRINARTLVTAPVSPQLRDVPTLDILADSIFAGTGSGQQHCLMYEAFLTAARSIGVSERAPVQGRSAVAGCPQPSLLFVGPEPEPIGTLWIWLF
ncbi:MAG: hypothetical protein WDN50_14405 [Bradyrhizobium sp.]